MVSSRQSLVRWILLYSIFSISIFGILPVAIAVDCSGVPTRLLDSNDYRNIENSLASVDSCQVPDVNAETGHSISKSLTTVEDCLRDARSNANTIFDSYNTQLECAWTHFNERRRYNGDRCHVRGSGFCRREREYRERMNIARDMQADLGESKTEALNAIDQTITEVANAKDQISGLGSPDGLGDLDATGLDIVGDMGTTSFSGMDRGPGSGKNSSNKNLEKLSLKDIQGDLLNAIAAGTNKTFKHDSGVVVTSKDLRNADKLDKMFGFKIFDGVAVPANRKPAAAGLIDLEKKYGEILGSEESGGKKKYRQLVGTWDSSLRRRTVKITIEDSAQASFTKNELDLEGLSTDYNGEPIGVARANIFKIINKAYKRNKDTVKK